MGENERVIGIKWRSKNVFVCTQTHTHTDAEMKDVREDCCLFLYTK